MVIGLFIAWPYKANYAPAHRIFSGSMQQMDEEKKGLWKTLMQRFSSKPPEEGAEKHTEK